MKTLQEYIDWHMDRYNTPPGPKCLEEMKGRLIGEGDVKPAEITNDRQALEAEAKALQKRKKN